MPVSGRELASLDFGNLIGGPLNAVVEAQAKSAIATVNFIKEVGFDKEGNVITTEFKYSRKNDRGSSEEFCLALPFLSMLPVPYVSITSAEIEFNAKITSTTESKTDSTFNTEVSGSAGGKWWFASARINSKVSNQKKSSSSDREERTFDMRVRVEARNVDMPSGTERILTMLENVIEERPTNRVHSVQVRVDKLENKTLFLEGPDVAFIKEKSKFSYGSQECTVGQVEDVGSATQKKVTISEDSVDLKGIEGRTLEISTPA